MSPVDRRRKPAWPFRSRSARAVPRHTAAKNRLRNVVPRSPDSAPMPHRGDDEGSGVGWSGSTPDGARPTAPDPSARSGYRQPPSEVETTLASWILPCKLTTRCAIIGVLSFDTGDGTVDRRPARQPKLLLHGQWPWKYGVGEGLSFHR